MPPNYTPSRRRHSPYLLHHQSLTDADPSALSPDFEDLSRSLSPLSTHTRASSVVDLTELASPDMAPPNKKRKAAHPSSDAQACSQNRPTSKKARASSENKASVAQEDSVEEVNLVDVDDDEKYAEYQSQFQTDLIKHQEQSEGAKQVVKLAAFQCIICLDNPTDLTVTHCGHMFCSICLHEALHAGTQKRSCPVCRTTIGTVKAEGRQPKNGFYALEMKLMTSKRKGKQPQKIR